MKYLVRSVILAAALALTAGAAKAQNIEIAVVGPPGDAPPQRHRTGCCDSARGSVTTGVSSGESRAAPSARQGMEHDCNCASVRLVSRDGRGPNR